MFFYRKVYNRDIGSVHFEGNETRGSIEAFAPDGHLIKSWDTVADNSAEFQSLTRKYYRELTKNNLL